MRLAPSIVVLVISAHGAAAQVILGSTPNAASSFAEQTIKVTTSFRTPLAAAEGQAADSQVQGAARRELYRAAESECAALSEIYKAECHLISVSLNTFFPVPNNGAPPNQLNATAVYELRRNRITP